MFDFLNTKIFSKGTLQRVFALAPINVFLLLCAMYAYTICLRGILLFALPDHHTTESQGSKSFILQKDACSKEAGNSSENLNVKVMLRAENMLHK